MAHFLTLPREVRDMVVYYVLEQKRNPPEGPIPNDPRRHKLSDYHSISWDRGENLLYEREWTSKFAFSSLLQVNCQLYEETKDALFQNSKSEPSYYLDVMLTDYAMMPTWLRVPRLSRKVDMVQVQIRNFLVPADEQNKIPTIWRGGCGGPPPYVWLFYKLLERFLHTGASGKLVSKVDHIVVVKVIEIDVLSPQDQTLLAPRGKIRQWLGERRGTYSLDQGVDLSGTVIRPEWLANMICQDLDSLLRMSMHTAGFGAVLYERIGLIRVLVDGEIIDHIDLSNRLKELRYNDSFRNFPREERQHKFDEWKANAIHLRKERGLFVEPLTDAEECRRMQSLFK